jgi:hypothetical protein
MEPETHKFDEIDRAPEANPRIIWPLPDPTNGFHELVSPHSPHADAVSPHAILDA